MGRGRGRKEENEEEEMRKEKAKESRKKGGEMGWGGLVAREESIRKTVGELEKEEEE